MLLRCPPPQLFDVPVSCSPLAGTRKSYIISGSVAFSCRPLLCSIICSQPSFRKIPDVFIASSQRSSFPRRISSELRYPTIVQVLGNLLNHHELNLTNLTHHTTIWPQDVLMISYGGARRYCRCLRTMHQRFRCWMGVLGVMLPVSPTPGPWHFDGFACTQARLRCLRLFWISPSYFIVSPYTRLVRYQSTHTVSSKNSMLSLSLLDKLPAPPVESGPKLCGSSSSTAFISVPSILVRHACIPSSLCIHAYTRTFVLPHIYTLT